MQLRSGSSVQEAKLAEYPRQRVVYASYDTAAQLLERLIDGDYEEQLSRFKWDLTFVVAGLVVSTGANVWSLFI
jgi:hypothetical protein